MASSPERYREWAARNKEHLRRYRQEWNAANPEKPAEYRKRESELGRKNRLEYVRKRKAERRAALDAHKREVGCVDCGTTEGRLEFDHRPDEDKDFNVAMGVSFSWQRIWAEVAKCDVRCAACHRRRHLALRETPLHLNPGSAVL